MQFRAVLLVLLALSVLVTWALGGSAIAQPTLSHTIYLPNIVYRPATVFGFGMSSVTPERGLGSIATGGTTWLRSNNNLLWRDVEPVEGGGYNWDAPSVQLLEQDMRNASANGLRLIVIARSSPRWATAPYQVDCAPINPAKYDRFAAFLAAAVARYSQPPYHVTAWEIGNEPDAYLFPNDSGFGCWGMTNDPYYGGRAYGAMLNAVYPAIKAADPSSVVLNGGLLLDHPYIPGGTADLAGRFIEGMFIAGAGVSFDVLSYHSYSYYDGTVEGSRGAGDWKIGYLRDIMSAYNIPQKPIINTEAALLCTTVSAACRQAQADAIGRYYIRSIGANLLGHLWYIYDSDEFNNTALVEPTDIATPRPSAYAYRHMVATLVGASYLGPLLGQPAGVEGYRFRKGQRTITAFWSDSGQTATVPAAPGAAVACSTRDGASLPCQNINGAVTLTAQTGPSYVVEQ